MNFSDQIKKAAKNSDKAKKTSDFNLSEVKLRLISKDIVEQMLHDYIKNIEKIADEAGLNETQKLFLTVGFTMLEHDINKIPIVNITIDDVNTKKPEK